MKEVRRCEETGKVCFESERKAKKARKSLSNRFRTYRCPYCKRIHITASPFDKNQP